jgi:hypothetical protein
MSKRAEELLDRLCNISHEMDLPNLDDLEAIAKASAQTRVDRIALIDSMLYENQAEASGELESLIDQLCKLGNGDQDGNSDGNRIAQKARTLLAARPAPATQTEASGELATIQRALDELAAMITRHNRRDPETGVWDYDCGAVAEAQCALRDLAASPTPIAEKALREDADWLRVMARVSSNSFESCQRFEDIANRIDARPALITEEALREAGQGLLDLMDEVPIDPSLGDETDRVFSRSEFAPLREALRGQA